MKIKTGIASLILLAVSLPLAAASKVIVTGEPVILTQDGEVYTLPNDTVATSGYYYVTVNNTKSVCYPEVQTTLEKLTPTQIDVKVNNVKTTWQCYAIDPTYFEVRTN